MNKLRIFKTKNVKTPTRGTSGSAGLDFYVPEGEDPILLWPGEQVNIPAGIKVKIPKGYALIAMNKSGRAIQGLQVGACVIDEDYQGEIHLNVHNITADQKIWVKPGEKLLQMLLIPVLYAEVEECDSLDNMYGLETSERGEGGFGSTGVK